MTDILTVDYLGLTLPSPVIVGACPLTLEPETVRQFTEAGAGAIVLPSMLQEQITHRLMKPHDPIGAIQRSGYQPQQDHYNGGPTAYLRTIRTLKQACTVPIIASLNGTSVGDWLSYASEVEAAGADALEFNLQSVLLEPDENASAIESRLCELIRRVTCSVSIPVAVKVSQRYTNLASIARQVKEAGAKAVVLFTHVPHWDVSIDRMHWTIRWELSAADSLSGILEGIVRVRAGDAGMSIAASGGVRTGEDAIKAIIAGADVVMVVSEVYREGPDAIRNIVDGIDRQIELSSSGTLVEFKQNRPPIDLGPEKAMRLEYTDPLTRAPTYYDPTPSVSTDTGDIYGHKVE